MNGGTFNAFKGHGLTLEQAERYAERVRLHPYEVWPDMLDEVLDTVTRVCAADGCDETFIPSNLRRIYCSKLCGDRRHKTRWAREKYRTDEAYRAAQIERVARYHQEVIVPARERRKVS